MQMKWRLLINDRKAYTVNVRTRVRINMRTRKNLWCQIKPQNRLILRKKNVLFKTLEKMQKLLANFLHRLTNFAVLLVFLGSVCWQRRCIQMYSNDVFMFANAKKKFAIIMNPSSYLEQEILYSDAESRSSCESQQVQMTFLIRND